MPHSPATTVRRRASTALLGAGLIAMMLAAAPTVLAADANRPPTADPFVGDTKESLVGDAPFEAHFEAGATDPDGDPLTYAWDFGFANDASDQATASHAHHTYTTRGRYPVTLEVSDGRGGVFRAQYLITVRGGEEPLATGSGSPTTGPAPLTTVFYGDGQDEQSTDLQFSWDFGVAGAERFNSRRASHTYTEPGAYTATLTVTDPDGNVGTDTVEIVVTGDGGPPAEPAAPETTVEVTADPTSGAAPLPVGFDAAVSNPSTTGGEITAFADGMVGDTAPRGTTALVRSAGSTAVTAMLTGLKPGAAHVVDVHEQPCAVDDAGPHFRFDESLPYSAANEIRLPFTSDATGASGALSFTKAVRAGPTAVAMVVHDPDNSAKRIGCADLRATRLDYAWDFGDGTTGAGPTPEHTYTVAGTYRATVAVTDLGAGHGERRRHGEPVTDSVDIVVAAGEALDTTAPQTQLVSGPTGAVRATAATFDLVSDEPGSAFECSLDGFGYRSCPATVSFRDLRDGVHRLQARARDAAGNVDSTPAVRTWQIDTRAPSVRAAGPTGSTSDRTPTLRATVGDAGGSLTLRQLALAVDGSAVAGMRYDARTGRMTWTSRRPMTTGRHRVRLVVVDIAGNRTVATWRLTVRR